MPIILTEVYDALKEAGASEGTSRRAAEAVAGYENKFVSVENRIVDLERKFDLLRVEFSALRTELRSEAIWMRWVLGTNIGLALVILWRFIK